MLNSILRCSQLLDHSPLKSVLIFQPPLLLFAWNLYVQEQSTSCSILLLLKCHKFFATSLFATTAAIIFHILSFKGRNALRRYITTSWTKWNIKIKSLLDNTKKCTHRTWGDNWNSWNRKVFYVERLIHSHNQRFITIYTNHRNRWSLCNYKHKQTSYNCLSTNYQHKLKEHPWNWQSFWPLIPKPKDFQSTTPEAKLRKRHLISAAVSDLLCFHEKMGENEVGRIFKVHKYDVQTAYISHLYIRLEA